MKLLSHVCFSIVIISSHESDPGGQLLSNGSGLVVSKMDNSWRAVSGVQLTVSQLNVVDAAGMTTVW